MSLWLVKTQNHEFMIGKDSKSWVYDWERLKIMSLWLVKTQNPEFMIGKDSKSWVYDW